MDNNTKKEISFEKFLALNGKVNLDEEGMSIEVTNEV